MSAKLPEKFAKTVLAELAGVRATVDEIAEILLDETSKKHGTNLKAEGDRFNQKRDLRQAEYYAEMLKAVGLPAARSDE